MKSHFHTIICLLLLFFCNISQAGAQRTHVDSVVAVASSKYSEEGLLRKIFVGRNYRKEWITPVKLPVFHLQQERGGLTIVDSGGGRQTNNLRLRDKTGKEWILRSVDKDIEKSMLPVLRNTMVETLMQDLQSALHPYAALTVPVLAEAAGITVATPQVYYIPDDPSFKEYRTIFANTVCFLEEREPISAVEETESSKTVLEKLSEKPDRQLHQVKILHARLLDMLVGDWDRHEDQWRWFKKDSGGVSYFIPIPRDRDFVYFHSDGLFIQFASKLSLPQMSGFTRKPAGLKRLNHKVVDLDLQWLNQLNAKDWEAAITMLQKNITDSVISVALRQMPPEIFEISGEKIKEKLIARRNGLMKEAMRYYRFLAAHPVVHGTGKQESFVVKNDGAGITVTIICNDGGEQQIVYERVFDPAETRSILIRGFGGNDQFITEGNNRCKIKLKLHGGEGNDVYQVSRNIKPRISDPDRAQKKQSLPRNQAAILR